MYFYKKKNKFPHVIYFSENYYIDNNFAPFPTDEVIYWLRDNIGYHQIDWVTSASNRMTDDSGRSWMCPYGFKTLEDAMAFKLRGL